MQINTISQSAYNCNFEGTCVGHKKMINNLARRYKRNYIVASLKRKTDGFDPGVIDRINTQGSETINKLEACAGQFPKQFKIHFRHVVREKHYGPIEYPSIEYVGGYANSWIKIPGMDNYSLTLDPVYIAQISTDFNEYLDFFFKDKIEEFCDNQTPQKVYAGMLEQIDNNINKAFAGCDQYHKNAIHKSQKNISQQLNKLDILMEYLEDFPVLKDKTVQIKQNANKKMENLNNYEKNITEENKAYRKLQRETRLDVLKYIFTGH